LKIFKYSRWLIAFIIVGLVAAMIVNIQRYQVEKNNMSVEMAIDYEGLVQLAQMEGLPIDTMLQKAKDAGITSLAVYETTFKKFNENGKASATPGSDILQKYHNGSLVDQNWRQLVDSGLIQGADVYVTGNDKQTFVELKEDLLRRLGNDRVQSLQVGKEEVLALKVNYEQFLKMNLGMPTDEMKLVNAAGFYVIARPSNYSDVSKDDVDAVFKRLDGINISDIIFSGEQTLGSPTQLDTTVDYFKARDITLGMIEHTTQLQFYKQDGLMEIAQALDYKAARVYSIPKDEQPKLKIATAVERWANTDEERNIRIDLMRIYEKPEDNMSLLATNLKYFSDTRDLLQKSGFTLGKAGTFENYNASNVLRMIMMLGVAAAIVLYLALILPSFKEKQQYLLFAVLSAVCIVPLAMGHGASVRTLTALASANLFPALAVIWQLDRIRGMNLAKNSSMFKIICTGVIALFVTGMLSFVGAAYVSGILADVQYLLEINIFRGIKLTFILPIILVSIAFLRRYNIFDGSTDSTENIMVQIKKILNTPIYIKSLLAFFLAMIVVIVFIGRSGHTEGMPVPGIELKFRAFLEQLLYARPRSKELLIGHPAFMLAVLAFYRKWPTIIFFVLVVFATIGQGSLVETFAHMRTPIMMSFDRGVGGIVLGAGLGVIAMLAVHGWQRLFSSKRRNISEHE